MADGAYAKADFLKPAKALGMTVVSRLRKDAALRTLPGLRPAGKRGQPRTYGEDKIRPGQAGRPAARLVVQHVRPVRREGGQAIRDVPGDLAVGRRSDPGGAGGRADRMESVLLLSEEIRATLRPGATEAEIQATAKRLLSLAA